GDDPALDNSTLVDRILALRAELAALLGFDSYAAYSLATKMADTPDQVQAFLRDLAARAKPHAQRDRAELEAFARDALGLDALEAWDLAYASEKLRQARYSFSAQEVKQYFTEPEVLAGLFALIGDLYGLRAEPDEGPVWHEDVCLFRLGDAGCAAACPRRAGVVAGGARSPTKVRSGTKTCVCSGWSSRAAPWSARSISIRTRARASAAAPGWTTAATAATATDGCRPRWCTWCATSARAWTAGRPRSRTMR